jgi:hypothetical protein
MNCSKDIKRARRFTSFLLAKEDRVMRKLSCG